MGLFTFSLPPNLPTAVRSDLYRASVTGGPDGMPTACRVRVEPGRLSLSRDADESGSLLCPWSVENVGHLLFQSATLIDRPEPYQLQLELARGKVNQLRNQAADWLMGGLVMPDALADAIREAAHRFAHAVVDNGAPGDNANAQATLQLASAAADRLVQAYIGQVFEIRQSRQSRLETLLGCRLEAGVPAGAAGDALTEAVNSVTIPFSLHQTAPADGPFHWDECDARLDWALGEGLAVIGGPLVDFSAARLPAWLRPWHGSRTGLAKILSDYTADVLERYQGRISTWQLTAASNLASAVGLNDDEMLWLTLQMVEAARRAVPGVGLVVGIAQPFGDYLCEKERLYSPFVFADTLLRAGLPIAALDLEVVMGVWPRGSYCRDLIDLSRMLDLYALLGIPLHVTLGYPGDRATDNGADAPLAVAAGHWRRDADAQAQADWAAAFAALALCKPHVQSVQWAHFSDAEPHQFPNCGLVDASGQPRPALAQLQRLRETYLH